MDTKYHEILGVLIVGPSITRNINEAVTIIETEMTVDDVLEAMHGHQHILKPFMKLSQTV